MTYVSFPPASDLISRLKSIDWRMVAGRLAYFGGMLAGLLLAAGLAVLTTAMFLGRVFTKARRGLPEFLRQAAVAIERLNTWLDETESLQPQVAEVKTETETTPEPEPKPTSCSEGLALVDIREQLNRLGSRKLRSAVGFL